MILVYTGNGKGKTCASVGQAVRAHGQGLRVAFGQFMKRQEQAGEQLVCATLFQELYKAEGLGFFRREEERPAHRQAALRLLHWAEQLLHEQEPPHMIVLDETLYALGSGLITEGELQNFLALAQEKNVHCVLSGRNAPQWLIDIVDVVTEMGEVKHTFSDGRTATKGIEF